MADIQRHPFHLVDPSPWPIAASLTLFSVTVGAVMYMQGYSGGGEMFFAGLFTLILICVLWWRDVIREGTFEGHHTLAVQKGLRVGMLLFILSEVMFFFAFFWAYFTSALVPTIEIGAVWPPLGIEPFNAWEVPLLNTLILLTSGATITWAHHALVGGRRSQAIMGLAFTIVLAICFTALQGMEYAEATFNISDSVYGSTFYLATGFHGFHVIIGTIFITVCFFRQIKNHFTREHHFGLEAAAWYWHFVDVVWLFLFVTVYWWGGL